MNHKQILGFREFFAICALTVGVKLTDDTPIIYFKTLANSAWMAPIVSGMIIAISLLLLTKVTAAYEESLLDVICRLLGKYIGWVVILVLFLLILAILTIDTAIYTDLISIMYFTNTPALIIYGLLMTVCAYGARKGISPVGSFAWLVLPFVKTALFVSLIATIFHGQIDFLFPFFGNGEWKVLKAGLQESSIYIDFLLLTVFASLLPSQKEYKKVLFLGLVVTVVEISLAMISFLMLFDFKSVEMLSYPWHEVIRYISFGFITNVEILFFPFWLLTVFVRFSVYLYVAVMMFGRLFNIKDYELLTPLFATLVVAVGLIPDHPSFVLPLIRSKMLMFTTPIAILLPLLLWILFKIKRRKLA